jgi:putative alpha-1,2-mannosidase
VLGAPLFKKVTVALENGKKLVIEAPDNSSRNLYVGRVKWNGKTHARNWVDHFDLLKGGKLTFDMDDKPNTSRGTAASAYPYSFTDAGR